MARTLALICLFALFQTQPAQAEGSGLDTFRDEAGSLLREFMDGIESHFDTLGPRLRELADSLGGMTAYEPPELLPNGDIIIRRRTPPEEPPAEDTPDAMEQQPLSDPLEL